MDTASLRTLCNSLNMSCKNGYGKYLSRDKLIRKISQSGGDGDPPPYANLRAIAGYPEDIYKVLNNVKVIKIFGNFKLSNRDCIRNYSHGPKDIPIYDMPDIIYYTTSDPKTKKIKVIYDKEWPKEISGSHDTFEIKFITTVLSIKKSLVDNGMPIVITDIINPSGSSIMNDDLRDIPDGSKVLLSHVSTRESLERLYNGKHVPAYINLINIKDWFVTRKKKFLDTIDDYYCVKYSR